MSFEGSKSKTVLEHSKAEQEEALLIDAPKIAERAVTYLVNSKRDLGLRGPLTGMITTELKEQDMKEATVSIAVLEIAAEVARKNIEELRSLAEEGANVTEPVSDFQKEYARFSALRELLLQEHKFLSSYVRPFEPGAKTVDMKKDLTGWGQGYKKKLEYLRDSAEEEGNEEEKKRLNSKFRSDVPLIDLFLKDPEKFQPHHYAELIGILEEEVEEAVAHLGFTLIRHLSKPSKETDNELLFQEEFIELSRNFISMLEGRKAEKIALR
jgi:hypothetical protein